MSRLLRAALILLFVASCGGDSKAPRNLDNACSIIKQRPNIYRALKRTERKWNVPTPVLMAMIYQESKFIKDARTPVKYVLGVLPMGRQSSAYGYAQALDATWKEYQRAEGGRGARRTDIKDAADFSQPVSGLSRRAHRLSAWQLSVESLAVADRVRSKCPRDPVSTSACQLPSLSQQAV